MGVFFKIRALTFFEDLRMYEIVLDKNKTYEYQIDQFLKDVDTHYDRVRNNLNLILIKL